MSRRHNVIIVFSPVQYSAITVPFGTNKNTAQNARKQDLKHWALEAGKILTFLIWGVGPRFFLPLFLPRLPLVSSSPRSLSLFRLRLLRPRVKWSASAGAASPSLSGARNALAWNIAVWCCSLYTDLALILQTAYSQLGESLERLVNFLNTAAIYRVAAT